jgi:hypothetical protein
VRSGHSRNEAEVFQQTEKCRIETSLSRTSVPHYAVAHPKLDTLRNLNHLLTHILDFYAIPFGTRYAVYDPVLSLWPFGQIPLHRLRLDLLYPKPLFSYCPSRRRGKSEGTVHGSPLLRVFKQNSEEVAAPLHCTWRPKFTVTQVTHTGKAGGAAISPDGRYVLNLSGKPRSRS